MSPKPIYEPGYEPGFSDGSPGAGAPGAGSGGAPDGAASPATRRYPQFWAVYPKATGVYAAEAQIDALVAEGVPLQQLVDGARAYREHVDAQHWPDKARYTAGPANWLKDRRWLDDYSAAKKAPRTTRKPKAGRHSGFAEKDYDEDLDHGRKVA